MIRLFILALSTIVVTACSQAKAPKTGEADKTEEINQQIQQKAENQAGYKSQRTESVKLSDQNEKTLGLNLKEYTEKTYAIFEQADDYGDWYKIDIDKVGLKNTFTHQYNDSVKLTGSLNDDGVIKSLQYNWTPDTNEPIDEIEIGDFILLSSISAIVLTPDTNMDDIYTQNVSFFKDTNDVASSKKYHNHRDEMILGYNTYILDISDKGAVYTIKPTS